MIFFSLRSSPFWAYEYILWMNKNYIFFKPTGAIANEVRPESDRRRFWDGVLVVFSLTSPRRNNV